MRRGFLDSKPGPTKRAKAKEVDSEQGPPPKSVEAQQASHEGMEAAKHAFAQLEALLKQPRGRTNPPNMDWIWEDDYEDEVVQKIEEALSAGVPATKVQRAVFRVAEEELGSMPSKFMKPILDKLAPDDDVGGQSVLHQLFQQSFPPVLEEGQEDWDGVELTSLPKLLKKNPACNLQDSRGDTILHILIRKTMDGTYFPDDSTSGIMYSGEIERWEQRAEYFEGAFKMLLDAGWSVQVRNRSGSSVLDLLEAAKIEAQSLVNDPRFEYMASEFASIPATRAAGRETISKMVKDRRRILEALSTSIGLDTAKRAA